MALNPNGFAQGFQSGFGTMDDYYTRKEQQRLGRLQEARSASKHEMEKKLFDQQTAKNAHDLRKLEDEKIKERSNVLINQITGTIQTGKVPSQELFTEFHELTGVDLWDSVNEEFMTASTALRDGTHQINSPEYLKAVNTVMNKVLNQHNDGQPFESQGRVRFDGEMGASYGDVVPIDGRKIIDRKVVNIRAMPGGRYGADVEVTYIDHKGVQRTYLAPMTDAGHTADRGLDVVGKDANAVQSFFLGQDMLLRGMAPMLEGMSRYKQSNDMLPTLHESTKVKIAIHQEKAKAYNLEAAQFLKANAPDDSDGALLQALAVTGNENALRALASQSKGGITDEVLDQYKRIKARANNEYELAMNLASGSDAVLQALQAAATPTNEGRGYGVGKTDTYLRDVPGGVKSWLIQPESVLDKLNKTAVQVNKPTGGLPNNTTANPSPEQDIAEPERPLYETPSDAIVRPLDSNQSPSSQAAGGLRQTVNKILSAKPFEPKKKYVFDMQTNTIASKADSIINLVNNDPDAFFNEAIGAIYGGKSESVYAISQVIAKSNPEIASALNKEIWQFGLRDGFVNDRGGVVNSLSHLLDSDQQGRLQQAINYLQLMYPDKAAGLIDEVQQASMRRAGWGE